MPVKLKCDWLDCRHNVNTLCRCSVEVYWKDMEPGDTLTGPDMRCQAYEKFSIEADMLRICRNCAWWEDIFDDDKDRGACNNETKIVFNEDESIDDCPTDGVLFSTDGDYALAIGADFGCIHWKVKG
jgi:hypothetical protein